MNEYIHAAVEAAEEAAKIQTENSARRTTDHGYKGRRDLVTEIDYRCEKTVRESLLDEYPDHSVLAEEEGEEGDDSDHRWVIDPLDGTTNYVHGVPHYAVSVAHEVDGEIRDGVVYHTPTDDVYTASKGDGAYLNGEEISVSSNSELEESVIATGFSRESVDDEALMSALRTVISESHGVRRMGSAATDLVLVASGVLDGFYERFLSPWDVAAGSLIVEEAGGTVTDLEGGDSYFGTGDIVATNTEIHRQVLDLYEE
ncbi:MAG: inositol monophosphatase family protein [Halobacteria archaeon]|nr:inositol monophosphatase family protein [Halobacteria archaeon]